MAASENGYKHQEAVGSIEKRITASGSGNIIMKQLPALRNGYQHREAVTSIGKRLKVSISGNKHWESVTSIEKRLTASSLEERKNE